MGISNIYVNSIQTFPHSVPGTFGSKKAYNITRGLKADPNRMTVGRLMETTKPLPKNAALLGQCADGLPFFLSLTNAEVGAILVNGDYGCGKTHQLQVIVDSIIRTHQVQDWQVEVFTGNTLEWSGMLLSKPRQPFLRGLHAWYDTRSEAAIQALIEVADTRRQGQRKGAEIILILDGMHAIDELSAEAQVNLHWLIEYGAQFGIWVVAAISTDLMKPFQFWVQSFRTQLSGYTHHRDTGIHRVNISLQASLPEPGWFRVKSFDQMLTYRLPLLGD